MEIISKGRVAQIIGAVVDVRFDEGETLPEIYDALRVKKEDGSYLILEVEQDLGENTVRCISMDSTDSLQRGLEVENLGEPITMPIGEDINGRLFNVIGQTIDGIQEIKINKNEANIWHDIFKKLRRDNGKVAIKRFVYNKYLTDINIKIKTVELKLNKFTNVKAIDICKLEILNKLKEKTWKEIINLTSEDNKRKIDSIYIDNIKEEEAVELLGMSLKDYYNKFLKLLYDFHFFSQTSEILAKLFIDYHYKFNM